MKARKGAILRCGSPVAAVVVFILAIPCGLIGETAEKKTAPSAARSVHLWYKAPEGAIFYNEAAVERSQAGSYFSVCGFNHGYFGIQELNGRGDKVVIFSVWDPGRQNNPNTVAEDNRVKVLFTGEDVQVSRFGNEGTGGKSMFSYNWQVGQRYKFCVKAKPEGDKTSYAAYFYLNEQKKWKHLVTFQTITGGEYLKGYYSFIEDFRRNGVSATQVRGAYFGGGFVKSAGGEWVALTEATFTADKTDTMNIDAVVKDGRFYLVTGGETKNTNPLQSKLVRLPEGIELPPDE